MRDQCCCCFSTISAIVLCLLGTLRPSEPKCYISAFAVPGLNRTLNATTTNFTTAFMVEFDNGSKYVGIQYDNVNFTVGVFLDRNTTRFIGNSTIAGFYQGIYRNAKKWSSVEAHAGAPNQTAKVDGKTYFRVNFTTSVKYKNHPFSTRRHTLWGGANVAVNDAGLKDEKDNIRLGHYFPVILQSGALSLTTGGYHMLLLLALLVHIVLLGLFS